MVYLRAPQLQDKAEILTCYKNSRLLHGSWTDRPHNVDRYLTEDGRYLLCSAVSHHIVGTFCLSGIIRGYFHSAYLGYEVFSPYARQGYMRLGLALMIQEAFGHLNLHRLEANIQPANLPSIKLVAGAGFVKEGYSKGYLNVGGKGWQDHERWALLNDNWQSQT